MEGSLIPLLTSQDSTHLFNKYYHARAKWYDIGLALGLSSGDLAALEQDHRGDSTRCFEGVITKWLRSEGEKTESQLSRAVNRSQALHDQLINFVILCVLTCTYIIAIVCILLCAAIIIFPYTSSNGSGDPFTTAVMALKDKYKIQPVIEFRLLHHASDMTLNITLRNQSEKSVIKDIDSSKFFNEVNLKYQTVYMQPTNYYDSNEHKSLRIKISGHPGAGKTTLMRHLAKEWAEGRALIACEILFLIHLDRLSTTEQKPQSLPQLLEISSLRGQFNNVEEVSRKIQEKEGAGVCFLFDSIDRWPHTDDFVHNLFFDFDLHFSLCISTARVRQIHTFREQSNIVYVDILGFNKRDLNDYLHALTSDQQVISSIEKLWDSDSDIKDLCKLPLHMVMLIHITNLNISMKQNVSIHTKTQLYSAFMKVTIQYNSKHLSGWNIGSLKRCILLKEGSRRSMKPENELCTAFQHLLSIAFDMLIHKKDKFPEKVTINRNIDKFGFVNVTKVKTIDDEVMYTFYHQTFVEFFAAIHLLSLPQEERLYLYIKEQQSERQVNHNLWLFFFGLIGEHCKEGDYPNNIIRQFAMYHSEQEIEQFPPYCQKGRFLEYLKEIHWKGKQFSKLLSSTGVVVNSTLFTSCGDKPDVSLNTLLYIFEHNTDIHTLMLDDVGNAHTDIINMLQMMRSKHMVIHHNHCLEFNAPKNFSMYLHMILKANADYREMMVDLNREFFMKYMLSVNILGDLYLEENTAIDKIMKQVPPEELFSYDQQSMRSQFDMTTKHIKLWKSLNDLISSIENLHQNNIEFFCETFQMLVNHLKLKKATSYTFDLKIDLGKDLGMSHEVSDSCLELVSSLDTIINQNIKLQKLTLIFPSAYFKTHRDEVIPHKLKLTGLKHLSIHLPESVMVDCYKLIEEVGEFQEMVTLELQHCLLRSTKPWIQTQSARINSILTNLPHTLQELTLGRSGLTDEDVRSALVQLIDSTQDLTSLSLPNNYITSIGLNMLVGALKSHGEFTSLDFSGNPITVGSGLKTLIEVSNLRELKLSYCSIGDTEIEILVTSLESANLRSLNLSGNPFIESERGLEPLARLTNLHHLDISVWPHHSKYGYRKAAPSKTREQTLLNVLKNLTQLRFLNLCSKSDPPIYWSNEMASVISQLPHLQVFNAPCLKVSETN